MLTRRYKIVVHLSEIPGGGGGSAVVAYLLDTNHFSKAKYVCLKTTIVVLKVHY